MNNQTFRCFDRDIPTGLSSAALHDLAEQISTAKRMPLVEVEQQLKNKQTEAATALNAEKRALGGRSYTFICS